MPTIAFTKNMWPPEIIILALVIFWLWALISVIRRTDFPGRTKGIWIVALLIFPFATPVIYLIKKLVSKKLISEEGNLSSD